MVFCYGFANGNAAAARREYERRLPQRVLPSAPVFSRVFTRLSETGSVQSNRHDAGAPGAPTNIDTRILRSFEEDPTTSTRQEASRFESVAYFHMHKLSALDCFCRLGVSQWKVWNTLNKNGLHPYHYIPVQELEPRDPPNRLRFCNFVIDALAADEEFLFRILWTDECKFDRAGTCNLKNLHVWSEENPHAKRVKKVQRQFSVNLWGGIVAGHLVGPYVLPDRLNGEAYLNFLQNQLPDLLRDVPEEIRRTIIFQHDGCPSHYHRDVREFLNNEFAGRWIGRGGPTEWPARSPDLTPLDFYLWGRMKELVYFKQVPTKEVLMEIIDEASAQVRAELTVDVTKREVEKRVRMCIQMDGNHFENYLK